MGGQAVDDWCLQSVLYPGEDNHRELREVKNMVTRTVETFGTVDTLINNAGEVLPWSLSSISTSRNGRGSSATT